VPQKLTLAKDQKKKFLFVGSCIVRKDKNMKKGQEKEWKPQGGKKKKHGGPIVGRKRVKYICHKNFLTVGGNSRK